MSTILNCVELAKAQKQRRFNDMTEDERRDSIKCLLNECYRYNGTYNPNKDEFQYLSESLFDMSGKSCCEFTPVELLLTIQAGLSGEHDDFKCEKKLNLRGIRCFINRLFAFRNKCKECDEPLSTFERMVYIITELKLHCPDLMEEINSGGRKDSMKANIKDILYHD